PIQAGATIRMRSIGRRSERSPLAPSVATRERAAFEAIARAAIRTHRLPRDSDVKEHTRMARPERHPRVRAGHRELPRFDEDGFAIACLGHRQTRVSHAFFA